ncbi:MAG: flavin reductase family protein [Thiolinea sp.]
MPPATTKASTVDRNDFITAMRAVANSVTVVTTNGEAGCHGGTVSAFCSVSADPPTILVCLMDSSRIAQTTLKNGNFCVNVLPWSGQHVADRFAGRHDHELKDRFSGIAHKPGPDALPIIENSTAFACQLHETMLTGSHRIFVGRVIDVKAGIPEPLIYFNGRYGRVDSAGE